MWPVDAKDPSFVDPWDIVDAMAFTIQVTLEAVIGRSLDIYP